MPPRTGARKHLAFEFPLSFGQQRLWILDQLTPNSAFYNLPLAIRLPTSVDHRVLALAVNEMTRRHEALRTCIRERDGEPRQFVMPFEPFSLPLDDLSTLPESRRSDAAAILAAQEATRPFDLTQAPLMRVRLVRVAARDHLFLVTMHHIVSDGWSLALFWQELAALYRDALAGRKPSLPEPPLQYGDFAEWQREWLSGVELERQCAFWTTTLAGLPVLALATDRPRPPVARHAGAIEPFGFAESSGSDVRAFALGRGVTPFMVLYAAFAVLLSRYTGQRDIVIGTPVANRNRAELEHVFGFFVNSLVLRLDLNGYPSFEDVIERARAVVVAAFAHQELPFERLVDELGVERDPSRNPLFQVTMQLFTPPTGSGQAAHSSAAAPNLVHVSRGTAMFDLSADFWFEGPRLQGQVEYDTDLFDAATIRQMRVTFETLLSNLLRMPRVPVDAVPLLPPALREAAVTRAATEARPHREFVPVWRLIREAAHARPDAVALAGAQQLTYAELVHRAEAIAVRLQAAGAGLDTRVGVLAARSADMILAICGTLAAGAAYVPLDPDLPPARLLNIVEQSGCRAVLAAPGTCLPGCGTTVIDIAEAMQADASRLTVSAGGPAALAYVIYTSGSTGEPKGVAQRQAGLANQVAWMRDRYEISPDDVVLLKTPFSFDASVWELFVPLAAGARLAIGSPEAHRDPAVLCADVVAHGVTVLQLVPSMLQLFLEQPRVAQCRTLRLLFAGGEALTAGIVGRVADALPGVNLHNLYGPTETCVQSVAAHLDLGIDARDTVPIGQAIPGNALYVLDERMEILPHGIPGELWIGGEGVARGYLGRSADTAARFVPNPFSPTGERLYRTGDRVMWRPDGQLAFLGRDDQQVNIRGFRVELGEIEAALAADPDVRRAVVVASNQLAAYVESSAPLDTIKRRLERVLPRYMVPTAWVALSTFPLLPSGKIDRASLPAPRERTSGSPYVGPRDVIEQAVADIWSVVLEHDAVSVEGDFFADHGGNSLQATRIVARVRELFQIDFPLQLFFEHPTISAFAASLRTQAGCAQRVAAAEEALQAWEDEQAMDHRKAM